MKTAVPEFVLPDQNKTVKLNQLSQNKTVKLKLPQLSQNKTVKLKQNQLSPFPRSSFPSCFHSILGNLLIIPCNNFSILDHLLPSIFP